MTLQDAVFSIAIAGIVVLAFGFILIVYQSVKYADEDQNRRNAHRSHVLQAWAFGVLLVVFVVGSWATMKNLPMPPQHQPLHAKQVVDVVGHQWFWQMKPATVKTGSKVEFRVTSADVNHDFAIYAPNGRIVAQVQAMPGYTNKMLHTFTRPGTYIVQCLEYCGAGHAPMHTVLHVVDVAAEGMTPGTSMGASAAGAAASQTAATTTAPDGAQIFTTNCAACHQASGMGMSGVFPPLKGNSAVNDPNPTKQIHVVLHGLHGAVVDGKKYTGVMPPFAGTLNDAEIAAVINHERSSWGNNGKPVTAAQVGAERSAGQ